MRQRRRCAEFTAYLYDNPDDPDYAELDARTDRALKRFGELRDELIDYCGLDADGAFEVLDLITDILAR